MASWITFHHSKASKPSASTVADINSSSGDLFPHDGIVGSSVDIPVVIDILSVVVRGVDVLGSVVFDVPVGGCAASSHL